MFEERVVLFHEQQQLQTSQGLFGVGQKPGQRQGVVTPSLHRGR